ncbi:MAG: glutamate-5-semialdehyde dehydrogenase [Cyanobacteria bacterium]|nr:glutamate-5-semialdehyde dehydrogenase [Cyanobacteriota bacterium]
MSTTDSKSIIETARKARNACCELANLDVSVRNNALLKMADAVENAWQAILDANEKDMQVSESLLAQDKISLALVQRLKLTKSKITDIANSIRQVADLPDPVGVTTLANELDSGLNLFRVTSPIGVLAVIFESRPDALPQIVSLSIKSANAVILKGGREAEDSFSTLFDILSGAAKEAGIPENAITLLKTREDIDSLLKADGFVDLIIPRGSSELVRYIQDNTRIRVLGHAEGICHLYVHEDADLTMARRLLIDAKTQYPSACNSTETLLVHRSVMKDFLPEASKELANKGVELRVDDHALKVLEGVDNLNLRRASTSDWIEEYCDLVLSIKTVDSMEEAIDHINKHGSRHTECIVTKSKSAFDKFFKSVDSAGVYWNASTRFADGFRYGFGAEVGIATGKLHPRGPVGLDGLVTYKYRLEGDGHIVEDYSGPNARPFTHRQL